MTFDKDFALTYVMFLLMSIWGGAVSYYRKLVDGTQFVMWRMIGEISTSAFAGIGVGMVMIDAGVSPTYAAAAAGIAGHMGATIIATAEEALKAFLIAVADRNTHKP